MQHRMDFLHANADVPFGVVTSTARKGNKWTKASAGDTLNFHFTEDGHWFGRATVTKIEVCAFEDILKRAKENYAGSTEQLRAELAAAYGDAKAEDEFTMVFFIRQNVEDPCRQEAYSAIDSERLYQSLKWGEREQSVASFLTFMRHHMRQAEEIASTSANEPDAMDQIRKVTTLGVACMEQHGGAQRTLEELDAAREFGKAHGRTI